MNVQNVQQETVAAYEVWVLTAQRKKLIQDELDRVGRVVSGDLAQRFGLSEDTIRRDLRQMAANGQCQRVYGGAVAPHAGPLSIRHDHLRLEKARLADLAVSLVSPKQTLIIDAGSTNSAIARALPQDADLTVITNAPDIAGILALRPDIELVMLGGVYDRDIGACLGPQTEAGLAHLRADWLFLGSCGLDGDNGVTAFDEREAAVKVAMAEASDQIAAAVTCEKLGTAASYRVLSLSRLNVLIAEPGPDLSVFEMAGVALKTG
ncbi:MAG: DeoR/GlpR family DNA-binding transcription regulator [Pseudomonadota bacterium]